jgi:nucleoside-diphosphate-sugar epimerase
VARTNELRTKGNDYLVRAAVGAGVRRLIAQGYTGWANAREGDAVKSEDAATATVAALDRGSRGVYNVVDDDSAPVADWLPYLANVLGAKPPRRIPGWLGRLAGGEAIASMSTRIRGSSNAKARHELRWEPRYPSWREGSGRASRPSRSRSVRSA